MLETEKFCPHTDKCYETLNYPYTSSPPKRKWICRKCLNIGFEPDPAYRAEKAMREEFDSLMLKAKKQQNQKGTKKS